MSDSFIIQLPENISSENINDADSAWWNNLDEHSRKAFNYVIELVERNEEKLYALDLFRIEGTDNKIKLHKIIRASYWNIAFEVARYLNESE